MGDRQQGNRRNSNPIDPIALPPEAGSAMAACWCARDGVLHFRRTTQDFPVALFEKAIEMLRDALDAEAKRVERG